MCGIAGAFDRTGQRVFPMERLRAMTRAIEHRGPDDEFFHVEPGVALGARRLAILDLAGGRQPIGNEDGSVWIAFNGELFEYPELRRELLSQGHRLATRCDTEAWVHLYEDSGEWMFERARGQFAVSLWDRKRRTLLLGRDRVGICPLYVAEADGWLLWGSEIKAILASGLVAPRPDPKGIDYFFHTFCAPLERTMFEGIQAIAPGHYWKLYEGRIERRKYWDLNFPDAGEEVRQADPTPLIDELEHLLRQGVERRLRSDVPVVSYISGGLDSTIVLGMSSRERGHAVPSFTIGLDNAGPDERAHSRESAEALGSPLTTITMDRARIAEAYPELIRAAEFPVMDSACACLLRLAETVNNQGYKVVLTGEGADEAFAGYPWFKTAQIRQRLKRTAAGRALALLIRDGTLAAIGGGRAHRADRFPIAGVRSASQDVYDILSQTREHLYTSSMWDRLAGHSAYDDLNALVHPNIGRWHWLNQSLYIGYKIMLAGLLLHGKGDRITMHSSVEGRYPFLDDEVIRFSAALAPEYKLNRLTDKWILRQVAAKTLPARIANRPKTMFQASRAKAFLGPHRPPWVDQLLSPESIRKAGYFNPDAIARERFWQSKLPRITVRRAGMDLGLTCAIATQLWHHTYCGGGLCDLPSWSPPGLVFEAMSDPVFWTSDGASHPQPVG